MYTAGVFIDLSLPDLPEKVITLSDAAAVLKNNTADILTLRLTDTIEVLDRGCAFLLRLTHSLPKWQRRGRMIYLLPRAGLRIIRVFSNTASKFLVCSQRTSNVQ
jgi:hypothetical protein